MATATDTTDTTATTGDATAERIRELNEQIKIVQAATDAGQAYANAYEKALKSIAESQEQCAAAIGDEWVSSTVGAQAQYTRYLIKLNKRELLS
jgi:hypothetical protein